MGLVVNVLVWSLGGVATLAAIFLLSLYIRGAFRWRSLMHIEGAIAPDDSRFALMVKSLSASLLSEGKIVGFWDTADSIQQARLAAIASAQRSIQFETFMMTPGLRAQDFAAALAQKAAEGVRVQILADGFGARSLPDKYWRRLRSAGVQVVFFNPFDWQAPANFAGRTHRKLLIIDSDRALIGGAGISDLWDGHEKSDDTRPWFDVEIALAGEVVSMLSMIFQKHWQGHRRKHSNVTHLDVAGAFSPTASGRNPQADTQNNNPAASNSLPTSKQAAILVTASTKPSYRNSAIERQKQTLIAAARERIWLSSPYFLPNESTRALLIAAHNSGVDVRILTTSDRSDKKLVYYASYEVYGPLLEAGIQIFEYQPSMLHAKMLIVDSSWVNTGSANFDYRSFLHNDELDILTNSPALLNKIEETFKKGFQKSKRIRLQQWQQRSWLKHRILGNIVRLVQWQL
ncbi:MAG: phosphatidylserine/phosphatidylglycerophosphate/cardiolipin synthase family protein [Cyanobacteria bacterium J06560_5]